MSNPSWPDGHGAKVLTLAGNDLTIDVRARKTASALARRGFRVIAIGIDHTQTALQHESLDGALLWRVNPPADPRVSPRVLRISRNETRDSFRYRSEVFRARLMLARRCQKDPYVGETESATMRTPTWGERLRLLAFRGGFFATSKIYRMLARPTRPLFRDGVWRRDLPELHRYESAIGSVVDDLAPDLIHVHDVFHIGLAVRAKRRAHTNGRQVKIVYDAHEYVAGLPIDQRRRNAYAALEKEYIDDIDGVVTVSPGLARLLEQQHGVGAAVVMNVPDPTTARQVQHARDVAGVPDSAKTLIYVGGIAPHRGAETLIETTASLDDAVHLTFVAASTSGYVAQLAARAAQLGLSDRVHFVPYVTPEAVVSYMESCDVSVIPLSRAIPNYEVALPNKLFQSLHAGVPVVVSDNPEMRDYVSSKGIGEVFTFEDADSMAVAIREVLENPEPYLQALNDPELIRQTSWATQMDALLSLYSELEVSPTGFS